MDIFVIFIAVVVVFIAIYVGTAIASSSGGYNLSSSPIKKPLPSFDDYSIFGSICLSCGQKIDWFLSETVITEVEEMRGRCDCKEWRVDPETYQPRWSPLPLRDWGRQDEKNS